MNVLVNTAEMNRIEWLEWRRKGIGGSDAAAIAGLSRYKSPMEVYLEKTEELLPEEGPSEAAYFGMLLEDLVAKEFQLRTGLKVWRRNAILQHPKYPFMIANLDRRIVGSDQGPGVLECKTASAYKRKEWVDGNIPPEYQIQLQHYLAVTGYGYAYIAVLLGGQEFVYRRMDRDDEMIEYLIKIEADFWRMVENRIPPAPDGTRASTELLNRLYPKGKPKSISLPSEAEELVAAYEEAQKYEKQWAERKDEAANKLKAMLGENEIGYIKDREVRWKTITSRKVNIEALKTDCPKIYDRYTKEHTYRRFAIR